jgi:hypothetical protein
MNYKVKTKSKKFTIEELESKKVICEVNYESIWNSNASFVLNGHEYVIKANNAWQSKFLLTKGNKEIGEIEYNWKSEIIIRLENSDDMTKHFILKNKMSLTKCIFELKDFLTNHLWSIESEWEWSSFNYTFLINRESGFEQEENNVNEAELMVATIYAGILYMKMIAGAA